MVDKQNDKIYTQKELEQIVLSVTKKIMNHVISGSKNLDKEIEQYDYSRATLTVAEAAQIVGISKPKVYQLIKEETLPALHIGRKILIDPLVLRQWMKGGAYE